MGKTIAESLKEEGEQKGLLQGKLRAQRRWLVLLLRSKFGKVPASTAKRIEATERPDLLDRWFEQALTAKKIEDVSFTAD
jgi:hypothetical protein